MHGLACVAVQLGHNESLLPPCFCIRRGDVSERCLLTYLAHHHSTPQSSSWGSWLCQQPGHP